MNRFNPIFNMRVARKYVTPMAVAMTMLLLPLLALATQWEKQDVAPLRQDAGISAHYTLRSIKTGAPLHGQAVSKNYRLKWSPTRRPSDADTATPTLRILSPLLDSTVGVNPLSMVVDIDGDIRTHYETLKSGLNTVILQASNECGNSARDTVHVFLDDVPPVISNISPIPGSWVTNSFLHVTYTADAVTYNRDFILAEGLNTVVLDAADSVGNMDHDTVTYRLDTQAPTVVIVNPAQDTSVRIDSVLLRYTVDGQIQSRWVKLVSGSNKVVAQSTDSAGNVGRDTVLVRYIPGCRPDILVIPTQVAQLGQQFRPLDLMGYVTHCAYPLDQMQFLLSNGSNVSAAMVGTKMNFTLGNAGWYGLDSVRLIVQDPDGLRDTAIIALQRKNTLTVNALVRDFKEINTIDPTNNHPDFQPNGTCSGIGDLQPHIKITGADPDDRNPVQLPGNTNCFRTRFSEWYTTSQDTLINRPFQINLTFVDGGNGTVKYTNTNFFPIDKDSIFVPVGKSPNTFGHLQSSIPQHNFGFTMEFHAQFQYKRGTNQVFKFTGDDDVWVFINDSLLLDLGGIHPAMTDSIKLDNLPTNFLVDGQQYPLDFFSAERHTSQSNILITTSLGLTNAQSQITLDKKNYPAGTTGAQVTLVDQSNGPQIETRILEIASSNGDTLRPVATESATFPGKFTRNFTISNAPVQLNDTILQVTAPGTISARYIDPDYGDTTSYTSTYGPQNVVAITSPLENQLFNHSPVPVVWNVNGFAQTTQLSASLMQGSNRVVRSYTDESGTSADTVNVSLDSIAPQIIGIPSAVDGNNGWYRGFATVSFACTDDTRLVFCSSPGSVTANGRNIPVTGLARDSAGNTASSLVSINRDAVQPNLSLTSTTQLPLHGGTMVTLYLNSSDSLSGLQMFNCNGTPVLLNVMPRIYQQVFPAGSQTISCSARDSAGNIQTRNFLIEVVPNHQPIPIADVFSVNAGDSLLVSAPGVLLNDTDIDLDTLHSIIQRSALHGASILNSNGELKYKPNSGFSGVDSLAYKVSDGKDTSTTEVQIVLNVIHTVLSLSILSPNNGYLTNNANILVQYSVNGIAHSRLKSLSEGLNTVIVDTVDDLGRVVADTVTIAKDGVSPLLVITNPSADTSVTDSAIQVAYQVDGVAGFSKSFNLVEGANLLVVDTVDVAGNRGADSVNVVRVTTEAVHIVALTPSQGQAINSNLVAFDIQVQSGIVAIADFYLDGISISSDFHNVQGHYLASLNVLDGVHVFKAIAFNTLGQKDSALTTFSIVTHPTYTQDTVNGMVVDGKTLLAISGVKVQVRETGSLAYTGTDGKFKLPSGGFGKFKLDITKAGFVPSIRFFASDSGLDFSLPVVLLMPSDSETAFVPSGMDTTVILSNGKVKIDFPAGATSATLHVGATVYNNILQLPNEQPNQDAFFFGVDFSPDGTTFNDSVLVQVSNESRLSVGSALPITYFNKSTGVWDDAGVGHITSDGKFIEFKVMHFSTFHGNAHGSSAGQTPGDAAGGSSPDGSGTGGSGGGSSGGPGGCGAGSSGASFVPLPSGDLQLDYTIPGGPALTNLDVHLVYWSSTANPRKIISSQFDNILLTPGYTSWSVNLPGMRKRWMFYGPSLPSSVSYVWPGRDETGKQLQTGLYPYGIQITDILPSGVYRYDYNRAEYANYYVARQSFFNNYYYGYTTLVNREQSPYGSGWAIDGITRIVRKKWELSGAFPQKSAYRALNSEVRTATPNGTVAIPNIGVTTALNSVLGDLTGDHVSILGAGADGSIFWKRDSSNVYVSPYGNHDTLIGLNPGWILKRVNGTVDQYDFDGILVSRKNSKGQIQAFQYDLKKERILKITDETTGVFVSFLYDSQNRLHGIRDQFNRTTQISVDENNDLRQIQTPDGIVQRKYSYNQDHRALTKTIPGGAFSQYTYDSLGGIIQTKSPEGLVKNIIRANVLSEVNHLREFSDSGYIAFLNLNLNGTTGAGFDPKIIPINTMIQNKSLTNSWRDNLGNSMEYSFNNYGTVSKQTNAKGDVTRFNYEVGCGCGAPSSIHYPNGLVESFVRDERGNVLQAHDSSTGATTSFEFVSIKGVDYLAKTTDALGQKKSYVYDTAGNLIRTISKALDTTKITYNNLSLPTSVTDPFGRTAINNYDTLGRLTRSISPKNDTTTYSYDTYGNLGSAQDGMGKTTTYQYDIMGRMLSTTVPTGKSIRYSYDKNGRLDTLIDQKLQATHFEYDSSGRMILSKDQLGHTRQYQYDAHNNLLTFTNAGGQALRYQYDSLERLITKINPNQTVHSRFAYDADNNMVYASTPIYAVNRIFDLSGRMRQENLDRLPSVFNAGIADTISAEDFSKDYTKVVVDGRTLIVDGEHHFKTLILKNGAVVKHLPTDIYTVHKLRLLLEDSLVIDASSSINLTNLGYLGGQTGNNLSNVGMTSGNTIEGGSSPGSGGSHGGRGGRFYYRDSIGYVARAFDDRLAPTLPGGGGGTNNRQSGSGGGVLFASAKIVILDGKIESKGGAQIGGIGAAGAGGSIMLVADTLKGIGQVIASGGDGMLGLENPRGGGGGRIFIKFNSIGTLSYLNFGGLAGGERGSTVLVNSLGKILPAISLDSGVTDTIDTDETQFEDGILTLDNASLVINGKHSFTSIILKNHSIVTHSQPIDKTFIGMDLDITSNLSIDSTSSISVDEKGYRGGNSQKCAQTLGFACGSTGFSGGSYGGLGGDFDGYEGHSYGSLIEPRDFGSGGASELAGNNLSAGAGGGRVSIKAENIFIDGRISADGGMATEGGAGSGGSILLIAKNLNGTGMVSSRGGWSFPGGGGGGGRISLMVANRTMPDSMYLVYGGIGKTTGKHGTIYRLFGRSSG